MTRRYNQFLDCAHQLQEMWPDRAWPSFQKKSGVDFADSAAVARLREQLDAFLKLCCGDKMIMRSPAFVSFIDPKSDPTLATLQPLKALEGWVELRKMRASPIGRLQGGHPGVKMIQQHSSALLTLSTWKPQQWAVLAKGRLYFYPDKMALECQPTFMLPLALCSIALDGEGVITVDRWSVGEKFQLRVPRGKSALDISKFYAELWRCNTSAAHSRYIRLMSEEDADILSKASLEAIRRATAISSGMPLLQPSFHPVYYEPDSSSNILITQGVLRGGTPTKLVEKLFDHALCPPASIVAFLLTFHSYLAPMNLLDQLMSYYRKPFLGGGEASTKTALTLHQLRVITIVQRWVTVNPKDFILDKVLCTTLQAWVMTLQDPGVRLKLVSLINKVVFKSVVPASMVPFATVHADAVAVAPTKE